MSTVEGNSFGIYEILGTGLALLKKKVDPLIQNQEKKQAPSQEKAKKSMSLTGPFNKTEIEIMTLLIKNSKLTITEIAKELGIPDGKGLAQNLQKMVTKALLVRDSNANPTAQLSANNNLNICGNAYSLTEKAKVQFAVWEKIMDLANAVKQLILQANQT